jgi:hypothetical protein
MQRGAVKIAAPSTLVFWFHNSLLGCLNLPLKPYRATGAGPQASSGHSGGLDQFLQLTLLSVVVAVILPRVTARPHLSLRVASAAALAITTQPFCSIAINPISHRLRASFVFMRAA